MGSRGAASVLLSRANRIKQKLQSSLEASILEVEDVSYQHAGHAAVKDNAEETHFNVKIRHRMVYELLNDELQSGLHAISIVAKTPQETGRVKNSRLKQAREEADRKIAQHRASLEAEYQKSVSETSANSGMNVKRLEEETVEKIRSLKDMSSKVSKDVVTMLMRQVTTVNN
ncbi:hypothetical protein MKX01_018234 [Papaver californicum]|nr:hypothetical protein MKX01_018234 [Papaver californicum]